MGQLTNFTEKKILDHVLKVAPYAPPATVYLGMSTADPLADGSGWANPTYTGYGRKAINFAAAAARSIGQTGNVVFDQCTLGASTVRHWGLWDAEINGSLLAYGSFTIPKTIDPGNTPSVEDGDNDVRLSFVAGAFFTAFVNTVLDWLFRAQALAQPTNVKIGLSTSTPQDDGTGITEPAGNNYSQKVFNTWDAATGDPMTSYNTGALIMPTPSGSWGLCTHAVWYLDAVKAGYGTIPNQTPDNGDTVEWLDGQFSIGIQ